MSHPGLDRLDRLVDRLRCRLDSLEVENAVLYEHLEQSGLLSRERFLLHVHRRRFLAALRRHPCDLRASLADLMPHPDLMAAVAGFAGEPALRLLHRGEPRPRPQLQPQSPTAATPGSPERGQGEAGLAPESGEEPSPEVEARQRPLLPGDPGLAMLYILGGNDDAKTLNSCERLHPVTNVWEAIPAMSQARSAAAAAVLEGRIYVCGGNHCGQTLSHVEAFDPLGDLWKPVTPLLRGRSAAGAAALFGRLYVCGGWSGKQALSSAERFDPAAGQWEQLPPMAHRREWPLVTADNGTVYLCGGQDGSEDVSAVELYDPSLKVWETLAMQLRCRRNAAVAVVDGLLYVCGGHGADGRHVLNAADRYNPHTGLWEALAPMQTHRRNSMGLVVAGRIYVMGGRGSRGQQNHGGGHALRTGERFEPATGTWESVAPLLARRYRAACAALPL